MKARWTAVALLIFWPAVSSAAPDETGKAGPAGASRVGRLIQDEHKIRVEINGRHFTDYNYGVEAGAPTLTQFFYPLKAPDGTDVAADQYARKAANLPGADHPHQRALRFSHLHGNMYIVHRPARSPWEYYLALSKFAPGGGEPLWSRRWDGYVGIAEQVTGAVCHCVTSRHHQTLDEKGYVYAPGQFSVQVIDGKTGRLVGQFGSYGNMDCQGKGSKCPHPELPFGIITGLSVWKDRLFVVDLLNRRIAKCRIVYGPAAKSGGP